MKYLRTTLLYLARLFVTYAIDSSSRSVLAHAIKEANKSELEGFQKMQWVLSYIKSDGTDFLKRQSETYLRWLIENKLL